jgi:hypothetical protein
MLAEKTRQALQKTHSVLLLHCTTLRSNQHKLVRNHPDLLSHSIKLTWRADPTKQARQQKAENIMASSHHGKYHAAPVDPNEESTKLQTAGKHRHTPSAGY